MLKLTVSDGDEPAVSTPEYCQIMLVLLLPVYLVMVISTVSLRVAEPVPKVVGAVLLLVPDTAPVPCLYP